MRKWVFIIVLVFELVVLTRSGSPASMAILWKMTGWAIFISFMSGVVALPGYSFNIMLSATIRQKLSTRQTLCLNTLGLTIGAVILTLFLGGFLHLQSQVG